MDKSNSVGKQNIKVVKKFLAGFIDNFDVSRNGDHIALLTFHEWVRVIFPLTKYLSKGGVKTGISKMSNALSGQTRTDRALKRVERGIFTAKGGDRPDRPNYIILFTDGKPWARNGNIKDIGKIVSRLEVSYRK